MCSTLSVMSIVAILVMDVRIGALQQELKELECHQCSPANSTTCEQPSDWAVKACPANSPYCATIVQASNFRSTLTCSADSKTACTFSYSSGSSIQLICICKEHLCNAPFSQKLLNELQFFLSKNNTGANLTENFYKFAIYMNLTLFNNYKDITTDVTAATESSVNNTSQLTTLPPVSSTTIRATSITRHAELPRAEALKHETTAPSDDDEDESEGSGAYEEARSHHAASAPAAPSSFLPANESEASSLLTNLILITSLVACSLV